MNRSLLLSGAALLAGLTGCSGGTPAPQATPAAPRAEARQPSPEGRQYRLDAEPSGAQDVIPVRADAADGEDVVVVGRIGGDVNPWVDGRAAFTIVDRSLQACSDIEGDACPTPWDYCCATDKLKTGKILVKFVDETGSVIPSDARELLGLGELDTVVIEGKVQKSDDGAAVILASALYVRAPGNFQDSGGDAHEHAHDHPHEHEHGGHDHEGHDHEGHEQGTDGHDQAEST